MARDSSARVLAQNISRRALLWPPLDRFHVLGYSRLEPHYGVIAARQADCGMRDDRELRFGEPAACPIDEHAAAHHTIVEYRRAALTAQRIRIRSQIAVHRYVRDVAMLREGVEAEFRVQPSTRTRRSGGDASGARQGHVAAPAVADFDRAARKGRGHERHGFRDIARDARGAAVGERNRAIGSDTECHDTALERPPRRL